MSSMTTFMTRWATPLAGGTLVLFLIFKLYGGIGFSQFVKGLRDASRLRIAVLGMAILLK